MLDQAAPPERAGKNALLPEKTVKLPHGDTRRAALSVSEMKRARIFAAQRDVAGSPVGCLIH